MVFEICDLRFTIDERQSTNNAGDINRPGFAQVRFVKHVLHEDLGHSLGIRQATSRTE